MKSKFFILGLLNFACSRGPSPEAVEGALAPWPEDPATLLATCDQQPFPELRTTCLVQAAARFAQRGDEATAARCCEGVAAGTWREECHFRVGEELGRAGETTEALSHCVRAGWFGRNCLTHTAWRLPPDEGLRSDSGAAVVNAAGQELLSQVDQVLAGAPDGLEGEGRDMVLSRFGYNLYVGTGLADPAPARIDGPMGVVLRTGFGIEAARLLPAPSVEAILAVWKGEAPAPSGDPLPVPERIGRYAPPTPCPDEQAANRVPVYGGGMRLVGDTPEEDATIAALEGLFWVPDTDTAVFLPWVEDPRPKVRWTAARLLRLGPSQQVDLEAALARLAREGKDDGVRWHAQDGLDHRTFTERRGRR